MADGKVNVEITGNAAGLAAASKQAASSLKSMETAAGSAGKQASTSLGGVDKAATMLSSSAAKAGSAVKTLESAATSGAGSLKNTANAATQAESKFTSMAAQSGRAALGLTGFGGGLASLVSPAGLASAAIVGFGQKSLGMAADFESSMARLSVMTGVTDKSSQSFKDLQAAAIKVGEDTKFSSQEAATGMSDLAAAGLNVKDTIAAIGPVAQAAMINQVGISDAAKVATVSMNAFGLSARDMGKVIDVTTTAANLGVLKFEDFGQAMAAVGSVAKLSNQGLTDISSALIALTNNGQSAQDAGTSIKSALLALTNPSAEAAGAMKELGLNIYGASGKMLPFAEIIKQVEVGTKGMTDAQRNQLLATVAGSDGIRAFAGSMNASITVQRDGRTVTLQGSDALKEFQRQLDNSGGAAQKAAGILENTFNAKVEQTKGKIDELIRKIGDGLLPAANQFLDTLNAVFDNGPLKSATDQTTRDLDTVKKGLDKTIASTQTLASAQDLAAQSSEKHRAALLRLNEGIDRQGKTSDTARNLAEQAASSAEYHRRVLQNLNSEIDRQAMAYQDTGKYYLRYAETTQQGFNQSEAYRKKLQTLNEEIDYNGKSFATLSPKMQSIAGKYGDLTGKVLSLQIAIGGLNKTNDELSGKISANNQIISTMDMGVEQLSLKHQGAKVSIQGVNMTLDDAYTKWKDYTIVQAAGGEGSFEAGKKAGELAIGLTKVDKSFQPLLDRTYNSINANSKHKDALVANTEATAKLQEAVDPLTIAQRKADDAFEGAAMKARNHGKAMDTSASGASNAKSATDKATEAVNTFNKTDVKEKVFKSNVSTMTDQVKALLDKIFTFNSTPIQNKTGTITVWTSPTGAYGPALPPSSGGIQGPPLPSSGGGGGNKAKSTGLSGAMSLAGSDFGGGRNAGNFGALSQATQQAAAAAFSLSGLKAQIDDVIAMFKSLDSKALKAASDQAEMVGKLASSASGMVDAFTKIQNYTSVSKEIMAQVAKDSAEFTSLYIAGAAQFKQKQLEGAALYIETSGKVASAAASMVDVLGKLVGYKGPVRDAISGFTGNVKDVTFDFVEYAKIFTKESLDGAATYIDTTSRVGSAISSMADGLAKVRNWSGLARESMAGFAGNVKDIVFDFSEYAPQFNEDTLKQAVAYAEGTGKIGSAISSMADGLVKVKDWSGLARENMSGFAGNVKDITFDFSEYGKLFNEVSLKVASDFAEAGGKVTAIIKAAVEGLAALKDYSGLNRANMSLFGSDMVEAVHSFESAGQLFKSDGLKSASDFAEAGGKVTGIIGKAVGGFASLDDYKAIAANKLTTFMGDLSLTMQNFQTAAQNFKPEVTAATATFAESAGKITDGLGKAVSLFEGLAKYQGVPQKMLTQFLGDVRLTVQLAGQMVGEVDKSLMPQIDAFGTAIGKLFDGLSKAMGVFQGLEKYKSIPSTVITNFVNEIILTVNIAGTLADKTDKDLMDKAKAFAKSVEDIFSKLKGAIDVFKGLETYKSDAAKTMQGMLEGILAAIKKMADMNTKAQELYDGAVTFAEKMKAAGQKVAEGMSAIGSGGGSGSSVPTDGFLPMLSGTGKGFALGGLVQQSGIYTVGEFGQEQVFLPGGSRVASNMASNSSTTNRTVRIQGNVYVTVAPPAGTNQKEFNQMLQNALETLKNQPNRNRAAGYAMNRGI